MELSEKRQLKILMTAWQIYIFIALLLIYTLPDSCFIILTGSVAGVTLGMFIIALPLIYRIIKKRGDG